MRKNVIHHYCDVCGKEVKSSDEFQCRKALRKAIKENFVEIVHTWDGEIKIKKIKYKTKEGVKDR